MTMLYVYIYQQRGIDHRKEIMLDVIYKIQSDIEC